MTRPLLTLTTDFGLADAYVGIMKGVILQIAPTGQIVDLSHQVAPQQVAEAAYLLRSAYAYFPPRAIHVAVVDPGVGTSRQPIAVQAPHGTFVGPDNGVFTAALTAQGALDVETGCLLQGQAVVLANRQYWRHPVSQTFHGRDIFAPSAAHLAAGVPLRELGPTITTLRRAVVDEPRVENGMVRGAIVHLDHFGNAISNIPAALVPPQPLFEVSGRTIRGLAANYQEAPVVALVGSSGLVEIAARNANAATALGIRVGDALVARSAL